MNTTHIKNYAPKARRNFIAAVEARAAAIGLTKDHVVPMVEKGDVVLIGDKAFPRSVAGQRTQLEARIQTIGFDQLMEAMAYTWFNRLMAIRFMELHGYLDHGRRVLSHPTKPSGFEILEECAEVDLPGLDRDKVIKLKLDGNKDEELYRLLLLAQCHALHRAMPFLFEPIDDETELLLPYNLTKTDSLIRDLVHDIPEDNWDRIEIIGWLYQFYISEKKDQVIGKVVKSEDIPAATQLFTPNWIVKYMVQNSLGAQWLVTYPDSKLKGQMEYYIEPAEQTDEVNEQLAAITPSQLNPEKLTLIDPASGSGHILVEAYELFKAIYLERGYRQKDVPQLILEKNLFGLDIDERAAQLTGFALMMKGRADDRRLFERGVKLNVMALQDSSGLDIDAISRVLKPDRRIELVPSDDLLPDTVPQPMLSLTQHGEIDVADIRELSTLFEHATTFGSLIQVPQGLAKKLPALKQLSEAKSHDLFVSDAINRMGPLVHQAELLAAHYDAVVANPPYMGSGGMNVLVKKFAKDYFPDAKSDLYACFIQRGSSLLRRDGRCAMITMQSWMFLSSFRRLREQLLCKRTVCTMAQIGYNSFPTMNSKIAQATVFVAANQFMDGYLGTYIDLNSAPQSASKEEVFLRRDPSNHYRVSASDLRMLPGAPFSYWTSNAMRSAFVELGHVSDHFFSDGLTKTGDNEKYLRQHWEIECQTGTLDRYRVCVKGGPLRDYFGNTEIVIDWRPRTRSHYETDSVARITPEYLWDSVGITWTKISSRRPCFRWFGGKAIAETAGPTIFARESEQQDLLWHTLAFLSSVVAWEMLGSLNPTLTLQTSDVLALPLATTGSTSTAVNTKRLVSLARIDWNAYERSWDFQSPPLLTASSDPTPTLESSYAAWITQNRDTISEMKRLEEENNRLFIDAYGLADELTSDVPIEQITLTVNPAYRYGGKLTEKEHRTRFRQDTMEELVSYAIGCMMGRYSLDAPGPIYAHSRNEGFDPSQYSTFPADDDGIVPLTDTDWFEDDACNRVIEFITVTWDQSRLEENLSFLAENLGPRKNEASQETIRRYLCDKFFKDHLKTYKKRPIYWLFSSGKQKAFQCLVFLHRYNEGTLARMRTEYVIPLQGKIGSRIDQLEGDALAATSTSHRKKLEKRRDTLIKQREELRQFDEKLRHYADQRISLDLDDGVKVNYGKFGDLLADVVKITGKKVTT